MDDGVLAPAVLAALREHAIEYEVLGCDPGLADTAAFCEHYGFAPEDAANTIVVASRKIDPPAHATCIVLATTRLDVNRRVCGLLGAKRASFADGATTIELTGMMIGGVTAFGITGMPVYVDSAVLGRDRVVMGGGNRASKLLLAPSELLKLPGAQVVEGLALPREAQAANAGPTA